MSNDLCLLDRKLVTSTGCLRWKIDVQGVLHPKTNIETKNAISHQTFIAYGNILGEIHFQTEEI